MKKMLLATALAHYLLQDVLNRRLLFKKQTGNGSTKTITHHFFVSEIRRENCRCSQNLWRRERYLFKTETQQTFVNGLLGFITLGIYTPLELVLVCSQ